MRNVIAGCFLSFVCTCTSECMYIHASPPPHTHRHTHLNLNFLPLRTPVNKMGTDMNAFSVVKSLDKSNLRIYLGSWFKDIARQGSRSLRKQVIRLIFWSSVYLLLSMQSRIQAKGMVPPTFRMCCPISIDIN